MNFLIITLTIFMCSINVDETLAHDNNLIEVFKWKQIEYTPQDEIISAKGRHHKHSSDFMFPGPTNAHHEQEKGTGDTTYNYTAANNIPMGVSHYKGRLFITAPRRRTGVVATVNVIDLNQIGASEKSPRLTPYPNYEVNKQESNQQPNDRKIISVYRTRVDDCNRLWFIDTGILEYSGNNIQVQPPSIWVIDLETDKIIKRFSIPTTIVTDGRGMASIAVDVDKNSCNSAYAYIPDLQFKGLYVYRFSDDRIWAFHHNYFSFDPLRGDLSIGNQKFQWDDGIFSITLDKPDQKGYRNAFFHAMPSNDEFMVSTKVLRNESNSQRGWQGHDFQHLGSRGLNKQSTMHVYDPKTEVIFYDEIMQNGIGCWNTKKQFSSENHVVLAQNEKTMIYPCDINVDDEGYIWFMTNGLPIWIYSTLDPNEYNFRVWKIDSKKAIQNTVCDFK